MPNQSNHIFLCFGPKDKEPSLNSYADSMSRSGFEFRWVVPPKQSGLTVDWFDSVNFDGVRAILVFNGAFESVADAIQSTKAYLGTDEMADGVFFGYVTEENVIEMDLQALADSIDDFFILGEEPARFVQRLNFRMHLFKKQAKVVQQAKAQSVEIARNETILGQREEFLSVCAHDLRSPLGLIKSCLSMILNDSQSESLKPLQLELLSRAKRQATQAIGLVSDLLDVMSLEQGLKPHYHLLDLNGLLEDFYEDYRFQAQQKNVTLHYENPVKHLRVLADADRIQQLFQNLITNALKFTEGGKNIYLRVSEFIGRRKNDPSYPMVVISLQDEGKGIPPREMQKIFDRFSQIKEYSREGGRGLGLTVAKQISNLHDGNIWVQSVEGKGSTFFVLFPNVISVTSKKPAERNLKQIIVAEPPSDRRELYFQKIESWGYEVIYAKDWVSAVALAFHQPPRLVLFGENPGKMGDQDVVNILREDAWTTEIPLVLAAENPDSLKSRIEDTLFDAYLKLPLKKADFLKMINKFSDQAKAA